jgi:hypothetical protein
MGITISGNNITIINGQVYGGGSGVRGSGKVAEEQREVSDRFDQVICSGSVDVEVASGKGARGLRVQADDNLLAMVKTRVEDGVLHVETEGSFSSQSSMKVLVDLDHSLSGVTLKGSGDVSVSGQDGSSFSAQLLGSGDLDVNGRVDSLNLSSMGSGDFNGQGLVADQATLRLMGSGDTSVHAGRALNVQLMGSGDCYYAGNPQLTKSLLGSGDLERV